MTEYIYNRETDGICSISEFMQHWEGCPKCLKAGICEEIVKEHYEEMNNELSPQNKNIYTYNRSSKEKIKA